MFSLYFMRRKRWEIKVLVGTEDQKIDILAVALVIKDQRNCGQMVQYFVNNDEI